MLLINSPTFQVPTNCAGLRADVVLAQLLPNFSRTQLSKWLQLGLITIDQRVYKAKEKVCGGEWIMVKELPQTLDLSCLAEDLPLNIVYEDDDFEYELGLEPKLLHTPNHLAVRNSNNIKCIYQN